MIKTPEQLLYEEIRHLVSGNYLVPKHMSEAKLMFILELIKGTFK